MVENQKTKKKIQLRIQFHDTVTGKRIFVEVFEPEEDNDASPFSEMLNAAQTCWKAVSHDEAGKKAIEHLNELGCSWVLLLFFVEYYCQHFLSQREKEHREMKKLLSKLNKRIARFETKIARWEAEIDDINSEMEERLLIRASSHSPDFDRYKAVLSVARVLALPSSMELKTKKECIVCLYHLTRVSTGDAHYPEVADVIQARLNAETNHAMKKEKTIEEHTLMRTVNQYKREDAEKYRESEKTLRILVRGAPFADYKLPVSRKGKK